MCQGVEKRQTEYQVLVSIQYPVEKKYRMFSILKIVYVTNTLVLKLVLCLLKVGEDGG